MIYSVAAIASLAQRCASGVATEALIPLVLTESGGDTLAINVNRGPRVYARTSAEGATFARRYMAAGHTVDVGLAQINSANFARLGVSVEQALDPCTNLRLSAQLLQEGYWLASRHYRGLEAISMTYSLYNTGTLKRGFLNGYVRRIWSAANALGAVPTVPGVPAPFSSVLVATASTAKDSEVWVFGQHVEKDVEVFK